jgi:hypothetical protein
VSGVFNCIHFFAAPLRALPPLGLSTAIVAFCSATMRKPERLFLEPAFLSGLLDFILSFLLFDRSRVLGAFLISGLLLALVSNNTLALFVWHGSLH